MPDLGVSQTRVQADPSALFFSHLLSDHLTPSDGFRDSRQVVYFCSQPADGIGAVHSCDYTFDGVSPNAHALLVARA